MKKIISCILMLSLVLTAVGFALPSNQNTNVKMTETQMMQAVGGDCDWFLVGMWFGASAVAAGFGQVWFSAYGMAMASVTASATC